MKHLSYIPVILCVLCYSTLAHARTHEVKVSSISGSLYTQIYNIGKQMKPTDTLVLNFDKKRTFVLDGGLDLYCNVIMKGADAKKTIVEIQNEKGKMRDDSFFGFKGTKQTPISVDVHNITVRLANHNDIWWKGIKQADQFRRYLFKFYHAKSVKFNNVHTLLSNAVITNLDMRSCCNITVTGCTFQNYNNNAAGGCLWLRGATHDVNITGNKFYKYGNDEVLAIFGTENTSGEIVKRDINITGNEFYYGWSNRSKNELFNDLLCTVITDPTPGARYVLENLHIDGNRFVIDDPCKSLMAYLIQTATTTSNVSFSNNEIINKNGCSGSGFQMNDVSLRDIHSGNQVVIALDGNNIREQCQITHDDGSCSHAFLMVKNCAATLQNNVFDGSGNTMFIYGYEPGGSVTLIGNNCTGLEKLASISGGDNIGDFSLIASDNTFQGDTRIYSRNLKKCEFRFSDNTFNATNYHFFLQEMAQEGDVTFTGNVVNMDTRNGGVIYASYDGKQHRFNQVNVSGNTFNGLGDSSRVKDPLKNARQSRISNNVYYH